MDLSKLFIDASVFIAAAGSPEGGSSFVLRLCKQGHFRAVCTKLVLLEAERNIRRKLGAEALLRFYRDLAELDPLVEAPPSPEEIAACEPLVGEKDAHVLAAALKRCRGTATPCPYRTIRETCPRFHPHHCAGVQIRRDTVHQRRPQCPWGTRMATQLF